MDRPAAYDYQQGTQTKTQTVLFANTFQKDQILVISLNKLLPFLLKNLIIDQENVLTTGHPMKCSGRHQVVHLQLEFTGCMPVPPRRQQTGAWLERGIGGPNASRDLWVSDKGLLRMRE